MGYTGTAVQKFQYERTKTPWWLRRLDPPTSPDPETRQIRRRRQRPWLDRAPVRKARR